MGNEKSVYELRLEEKDKIIKSAFSTKGQKSQKGQKGRK